MEFDKTKTYISPAKEMIMLFIDDEWKQFIRTDVIKDLEKQAKEFTPFPEQFKSLQSAKGYSEQDMRKCFEAGRDYQRDVDYDEDECPDFDDYLTTIKPAG